MEVLVTVPLFQYAHFFLDFSIMSLSKVIMIFFFFLLYYVNSINSTTAHLYRNNILQVCYLYLQSPYFAFWLCKLHINLSGDTELNPGPKSNYRENFSVCHWNLSISSL